MMLFGVPIQLLGPGALLLASMIAGAIAFFAKDHTVVVVLALGQALIYVPAAFWAWQRQGTPAFSMRNTLLFVLGLAAVLRALILFAPPHSTDIYRYVWDGRVQAAGINPYLYIPADPALAHLRDEAIYPGINRKEYAPTIYPPTAQIVYWAATRLGESVTVMKLAMLGFEALAIWAILSLLAARGLPQYLVLIYAWHPLAIWEVAGSGHIDVVAMALLLLGILAAERGKAWAAGAALAAATLAKYFPLVVAPALWRRGDWKMPLAVLLTGAALYVPYLSAGEKIFGFLGGYADEGGLRSGEGIFLAALFRKIGLGEAALPLFFIVFAALLGTLAWRTTFRDRPEQSDIRGTFALAAAFTVLVSPPHAWYFLWLIPFLCFVFSPAVLYLTLAATALYRVGWPPSLTGAGMLYGPFMLLMLLERSKLFSKKEVLHESARD
ncbi:MAG: glycosyltransferase 87 family protein [Rhodomicrobiaceae bacterium]